MKPTDCLCPFEPDFESLGLFECGSKEEEPLLVGLRELEGKLEEGLGGGGTSLEADALLAKREGFFGGGWEHPEEKLPEGKELPEGEERGWKKDTGSCPLSEGKSQNEEKGIDSKDWRGTLFPIPWRGDSI